MQWYSFSLITISCLLTTLIYGLSYSSFQSVLSSPSWQSQVVSQPFSGNEILLNGRTFSVPWTQWTEGNQIRWGISDIGAMQLLGLELESNNGDKIQPIQWFSSENKENIPLPVKFITPYRYLDVTDFLENAGIKVGIQENNLFLTTLSANIVNLRLGKQEFGQRIVLDLDRPTPWQISQNKTEGVVIVEGITPPDLLRQYPFISPKTDNNSDEDDLSSQNLSDSSSSLVGLENKGTLSKIRVNLPPSQGLRVFSLNNPPRLVIDVRPDYSLPQEIRWTEGIIWRRQEVTLQQDNFPVTWLEIDQRASNLQLKPILRPLTGLEGINPLVTMANLAKASAAINGGFFNRNNKLPLGAIRQDQQWLSGPILNRGAIAWDQNGYIKMSRLSLKETLVTNNGQRLPILFLNSAYLDQGLARYTSAWGDSYTPLTDNEIIISVQNNQVIGQKNAGKAGNEKFTIFPKDYILVIRKNALSSSILAIGTTLSIESQTQPPEFANFPNILGAGPLLLQNGQIVLDAKAEGFSPAFQNQQASRSGIALHRNGKLMLVAVHHRINGKGVSLSEFAQILQKMGAKEALNLDGGSSTSLSLGGQLIDRSAVTAARVHNGIGVFVNSPF